MKKTMELTPDETTTTNLYLKAKEIVAAARLSENTIA